MTDAPPPPSATPGDIEAALESVRAGIAVPPSPPLAAEPPLPPPPRRSGWLGTSVLLLVAALLGGTGALYLPGLTGLAPPVASDDARRIAALEARFGQRPTGDDNATAKTLHDLTTHVDEIDQRVRGLEAKTAQPVVTAPSPASAGDGALAQQVAAVSSALGDLGTRLAALESSVAALVAAPPLPAAPAPAPAPAVDTAALADLVARVDSLGAQFTALNDQFVDLEANLPAPDLVPALDRRISELENADPGRAARNAALALTVARLGDAVAAGRPFAAELAALKLASPATDVALLEPFAATGLPSLARLATELEALDPAIRAGADEDRGGDWIDRLWRGLGGLVTVRSTGEPAGDAPEDRLDRARRRLADGDLRAAIGELEWLWGHARTAAAPWLGRAKTRIALDDALAALTLAILQDLSRP